MADSAFRFLLRDDGQPYHPARCFIIADPEIDDRQEWTLQLEPPEDVEWFYEIDDIKDWMLHGKPKRQIIFDRSNPRTPFRDLDRDEVFREYLRKFLDKIPSAYQSRRKYALMPSIADDAIRTRYKDALEAAIPNVTVLPEPEMVAEYFRLLDRNLELDLGKNNVLLVVDVGASTANMSLIISRRDQTIVELDATGARRDLRLRALRGDSDDHAGRWVDKRLAETMGVEKSDAVLRDIEHVKLQVSSSGISAPLESSALPDSLTIDQAMLTSISSELWTELRPLFERLCERLYENQTSSEDARQKSEQSRLDRRVSGPSDAYRLIDTVMLAGGTSLLPGFQEAMLETLFPGDRQPPVLRVGSAFAVAAAAGGLAHILHNYVPGRLREPSESRNETFTAPLEATLPYPLLLGIKQAAERENFVTLLDPNDPFVDDGGTRSIDRLPALAQGAEPKTRIVPASSAGVEARRGRRFLPTRVHESPGKMELEWDQEKERASIKSKQVKGTSHLWIDANKLRKREEVSPNPYNEHIPPNALAVDGAPDIILDVGMSKVVAVTAERGWFSTEQLEQFVHDDASTLEDLVAENDDDDNDSEIEIPNGGDAHPIRKEVREVPLARDENGDIAELTANDDQPAKASSTVAAVSPSLFESRSESNLSSDWDTRVADAEFSHALTSLRDVVYREAPLLQFDDIVVALLAIAVRPIVLLAGPPGCGKSTLVRLIAHILGKQTGESFHDVAVQAHWENDDALFGDNGMLEALLNRRETAQLILFDEFNLTRPEYYLSRLFHALDSGSSTLSPNQSIAPCRVFGTLNIDEFSRPPSPKVIDRCFLIELSQVDYDSESPAVLPTFNSLKALPGLPKISMTGEVFDERIDGVLSALHFAVYDHNLRPDLLPSRRVLSDIKATLSLHHRLDLQGKDLLDRSDLVDRLIASRILVKLSGAFDQLEPALKALEGFVQDVEELPRTRRRLELARQQTRLGFVSPWQ